MFYFFLSLFIPAQHSYVRSFLTCFIKILHI
nr:MAG TPA: hypothetical protein [Caudoviricetes sp.]